MAHNDQSAPASQFTVQCDSGPADHSRRRLILATTVRRTMTSGLVFHVKPCQHNEPASTSLPICVVHSHLQRPGRTKARCT